MMVSQTIFSIFRKYINTFYFYELKIIKFQNLLFIAICMGYYLFLGTVKFFVIS